MYRKRLKLVSKPGRYPVIYSLHDELTGRTALEDFRAEFGNHKEFDEIDSRLEILLDGRIRRNRRLGNMYFYRDEFEACGIAFPGRIAGGGLRLTRSS